MWIGWVGEVKMEDEDRSKKINLRWGREALVFMAVGSLCGRNGTGREKGEGREGPDKPKRRAAPSWVWGGGGTERNEGQTGPNN